MKYVGNCGMSSSKVLLRGRKGKGYKRLKRNDLSVIFKYPEQRHVLKEYTAFYFVWHPFIVYLKLLFTKLCSG